MNDELLRNAESEGTPSRVRSLFPPVFVIALATLLFALTSAERFPLTWDEGDAFFRAERVGAWLDALALGPGALRTGAVALDSSDLRRAPRQVASEASSRRELFSQRFVALGFPHTIYAEGHPAGYSLSIAIGTRLARLLRVDSFFSEKVAFRFGGICLLTLAATAVFLRAARAFGVGAGLAAVVGTLSCPHVFGHALIAGGDSLLISSWLFAWTLFPSAERRTTGAILWGVALGLSFSAKFSGFLLVAPFAVVFVLQTLVRRSKASFRVAARLALGVAVGLAFFMLVNPPLWRDPFGGLATFWELNVQRSGFNIPTFFFGEFYTLDHPLPWWNGFFWVVATVPFFLTALASATLVYAATRRRKRAFSESDGDPRGLLVLTAFALGTTLPIARAFPGVPVHDGVRLLVASTSFWGLLGGLGAAILARLLWSDALGVRRAAILRFATATAFLAPGVVDLVLIAPQYLSFYSAAVGGLVGAPKKGLEPTYYWDAFDSDVAAQLRALTLEARDEGRPSGVLFGGFSSLTLYYYKEWGTFATSDVATISDPTATMRLGDFGFYATQRRPSALSSFDLLVAKNAKLVFVKKLGDPLPNPFHFGREKVVVLEAYDLRGKAPDENPR